MNLPGFSIGLGPIPWVINAEVFPKEAKVVAPVKINDIVRALTIKSPKHYMIPTIRTLAPHFALLSTGSAPSSLLDSIQAQLRWVLHLDQSIIVSITTILLIRLYPSAVDVWLRSLPRHLEDQSLCKCIYAGVPSAEHLFLLWRSLFSWSHLCHFWCARDKRKNRGRYEGHLLKMRRQWHFKRNSVSSGFLSWIGFAAF